MNLWALEGDFRTKTDDLKKPYLFKPEDVAAWFSEAEQEAAIRSKLIVDEADIDIVAGDKSCDLPGLLFDIQYAELIDSSGKVTEVIPSSRGEMDLYRKGWRQNVERPDFYIHDDKTLVFCSVVDASYTLHIEFFRIPKSPLKSASDEPEINAVHHAGLIDWALFRGYSKPDADTFNPGKARDAEGRFESMFGKRPTADLRRRQNANRPHRNHLHL